MATAWGTVGASGAAMAMAPAPAAGDDRTDGFGACARATSVESVVAIGVMAATDADCEGAGGALFAMTTAGTGAPIGLVAAAARCCSHQAPPAETITSPISTSKAVWRSGRAEDGLVERIASPASASPPGRPLRLSRSCSIVLMTLIRFSPIPGLAGAGRISPGRPTSYAGPASAEMLCRRSPPSSRGGPPTSCRGRRSTSRPCGPRC